jgi:hypothetical protein
VGNQQKATKIETKNHNTVDRKGREPTVMARVVHAPTQEGLSKAGNDKVNQKPLTAKVDEG